MRPFLGRLGKIWRDEPGKGLGTSRDHASVTAVTPGVRMFSQTATAGFRHPASCKGHVLQHSIRRSEGACTLWLRNP